MTAALKMAPNFPVDPEDGARADFYALLARLFYAPPDAGLLDALAREGVLDAAESDAGFAAAWSALRRAAANATGEAVRDEYGEIFIGVGKPEVILHASYYLSGFLNEKPLAELRSDLAALGLARSGAAQESEDHIAGLADVMRRLILDENSAPAEREAAQRRFFSRHVEPWYGELCEAVEAAQASHFYRNAAAFARAFLDTEREFFRMG